MFEFNNSQEEGFNLIKRTTRCRNLMESVSTL